MSCQLKPLAHDQKLAEGFTPRKSKSGTDGCTKQPILGVKGIGFVRNLSGNAFKGGRGGSKFPLIAPSFLPGNLEKSLRCKRFSGVGFQVAFEFSGPTFVGEGAIELDLPGGKICGMRTATLVMREKPLLQVFRETNVGLFRVILAPQNIHVKHAPAWFCAHHHARQLTSFLLHA